MAVGDIPPAVVGFVARYLHETGDVQSRHALRLVCRDAARLASVPRNRWSNFFNISDALAFASKLKGFRVWAEDRQKRGSQQTTKVFHVATVPMFLRIQEAYKKRPQHFYEVIHGALEHDPKYTIQSSLTQKTRFYIDMEYLREFNPGAPEDTVVIDTLVAEFTAHLKAVIQMPEASVRPVVLTAHSDRKFSAHVVFVIHRITAKGVREEVCFPDNAAVGAIYRLWEYQKIGTGMPYYANDDNGQKVLTVDPGVYNSGRQMRLLGSSKMDAPERVLRAVDPKTRFLDTIIQDHTDGTFGSIVAGPTHIVRGITEPDGVTAPLSTYMTWKRITETTPTAAGGGGGETRKRRAANQGQRRDIKRHRSAVPDLVQACCNWITGVLQPGATVRDCMIRKGKLYVTLAGAQNCAIKKARHKKNNVYYCFDIQLAAVTQYCWDEVCLQSDPVVIPVPDDLAFLMRCAREFHTVMQMLASK